MSLSETSGKGLSSSGRLVSSGSPNNLSYLPGVLHTLCPVPTLTPPLRPRSYDSDSTGDLETVSESRSGFNTTASTSTSPGVNSRIDMLKDAILDIIYSNEPARLKLSVQEFQELKRLAHNELLPGWDRLHIDYDEEYLNIKVPAYIHSVFHGMLPQQHNTALNELVKLGGSSDIALFQHKQVKSPNFSLYENLKEVKADPDPTRRCTPTAVFEIGVSDTVNKLNLDAARVLMGTYGLVGIVMNVNVKTGPKAGQLDWVTADLWYLQEFERPNDDYTECAIRHKETITYYDVDAGCYKVAKELPSTTTCWKYFYCFKDEEEDHTHFIVQPFEQYLVHYDSKSLAQPPKPLVEFTTGPIEIPHFLLVTSSHPMYSLESSSDIDLTIEFDELLKHIQECMERDEDAMMCDNQHSMKRSMENVARQVKIEKYQARKRQRVNKEPGQ